MKSKLLISFFLASFVLLSAQRHEIGVFLGGANLISDIGNSSFVRPLPVDGENGGTKLPFALGLLYRKNLNLANTERFKNNRNILKK